MKRTVTLNQRHLETLQYVLETEIEATEDAIKDGFDDDGENSLWLINLKDLKQTIMEANHD